MGGFNKSQSSNANTQKTTNTQQITTTNANADASGAGAIGASGGSQVSVTNVTSDLGALRTASDIAHDALGSSANVAQAGLDTGRKLGESSLDFANEFGNNAINAVEHSTETGLHSALDYGTGITSGAFDLVGKALSGQAKSNTDTASILGGAITSAANASRTDSSQNIDNLIKYGSIAAGVIVLGIAAVIIFKR